jgi:hypothetical protein
MIRSYLIRDHLVMPLILLHILVRIIFSLSSEKDPEASTCFSITFLRYLAKSLGDVAQYFSVTVCKFGV